MSLVVESLRDHKGDLTLDCDVVVVGSGAGGSVVATELALSGQKVIVLEEGAYVPMEQHGQMRPTESLRHVWRDGGFTVAMGIGDSPAINVTMGRAVGGSSLVTGGVCFRVPDPILRIWERELGLEDYTPKKLDEYFTHVEKAIHVEEVPASMRSRSTELFAEGAAKLGWPVKPMKRNTQGCEGCGRCNFGCPHGAKLSVDKSYLPRAIEAGAKVYSHCLVERVVMKGRRAVGVRGRLLSGDGRTPGGKLVVHAKRVVVAAGGWHTPQLLRKSRVGNDEHVGHHMTLHPGFRVLARFDKPVLGWKGALQSVFVDDFEHEGITLTGLFVPTGILGATMPGVGPEHTREASRIGHLAMMGGIVHDDGGGTVHSVPFSREPVVTYRMSPRDKARIPRAVGLMADAFFAAGAKMVYPPVLGMRPVDADGFRKIEWDRIPGSRIECASQHPLGSARMGCSPGNSVVNADGQVWDTEELYVADGSVLPSSLGVNPQLAVMSVATRIAWKMRDRKLPEV